LIKDAAEKLPIVDTIIKAAFPGHKRVKNSLNKRALIISALINPWLSRSNFTYRINTLLISGGCRSEEVDCFHKLGLSSHYNTLRNMQTNAGVSHDKVLIEWKDSIVDAKTALLMNIWWVGKVWRRGANFFGGGGWRCAHPQKMHLC
jgi:hypothetical protein